MRLLIITLLISFSATAQKVVLKGAKPVVTVIDTFLMRDPNAITRITIDSVNNRLKQAENALAAYSGSFTALTSALTKINSDIASVKTNVSGLQKVSTDSVTMIFPQGGAQFIRMVDNKTIIWRSLVPPTGYFFTYTDSTVLMNPIKP